MGEALALDEQAAAAEFDQLAAQVGAHRPEFFVGDEIRVEDFLPEFGRVDVRLPTGAAGMFFPPEFPDGAFHPAHEMNAVGDVADGHLLDGFAGIEALPHVAADLAVQFADGVGGAGKFQRQNGHAERLVAVAGFHAAQAHEIVGGEGELGAILLHRVIYQAGGEAVVARLDRRVRGENTFRPSLILGLGEFFSGGNFFTDEFKRQKRGVALVHVERGRFDAERAQQAHAADAEQHFLHDARGAVAAIDAQGQIAEVLFVLREIRVKEIDRDAADVDAPGAEGNLAGGDFHRADDGFALVVQHGLDGQIVRVEQIVVLGLPVVLVNRLLKITFAIKQTDADEAEAEIAGRLGVVAGKNAQAAGGDGQRFMEAELGGEIGGGIFFQRGRVFVRPGGLVVHVRVERLQHGADAVAKLGVLQADAQLVIRNFMQHGHGVVVEILPAARGEFVENLLRLLVPGPPEIAGEFLQPGSQFRQFFVGERFLRHSFQVSISIQVHPIQRGHDIKSRKRAPNKNSAGFMPAGKI